MKKYLDILIFTLLFFLLFSFFTGQNETQNRTGIDFEVQNNSYKVPAGVQLQVSNYDDAPLSVDTCEDIELRKNGEQIVFPKSFCTTQIIESKTNASLDMSPYYEIFAEPGTYTFEYTSGEKKFSSQTEIKYRGTFGKIFIGLFYAPVFNLLAFFIDTFNNSLGLAIVAITIVIRIVLLYPQHKMLVSQRKMQAIQPKIKKLQEKHKGNQQAMGIELMKLYKTEGVNPMGSCGLLLIQMPILLVIYNIIMNITSLKNEFYLYDFLSEFHISQIDYNFFGLDLLGAGGVAGLALALTVGAIQYTQIKLSLINTKKTQETGVVLEKKKDETGYNAMMPDPEMMNKFMLYGMPAMVTVFTYTLIAGVGIYWGISTLFAIFQQLFVNKIVKSK